MTQKTAIPSAEILGVTAIGNSWTIESVMTVCSCGRCLGVLEYKFSIYRANNIHKSPSTIYKDFANLQHLKICCRNNFFSRSSHTVVSADVGSYVVETPNSDMIEIKDSPLPISGEDFVFSTTSAPPPLLTPKNEE